MGVWDLSSMMLLDSREYLKIKSICPPPPQIYIEDNKFSKELER